MKDKESLFKFIQSNAVISEAIINEIVKHFEVKNVRKDDFILSAGKICNEYMFLEEGYIRAYIYDYNGDIYFYKSIGKRKRKRKKQYKRKKPDSYIRRKYVIVPALTRIINLSLHYPIYLLS